MKKLALLVLLTCAPALYAQDFIQNYSFVTTGTKTPGTNFANTGITSFFMSWSPQTSMNSCSVQADSSADGSSWGSGDLIASQSCTTVGSATLATLSTGKFFVRVNVTVMSGNGGLNVTLKGWGGGGGGSSSPVNGFIYPTASPYNAKFDVSNVADATTTNGNNIVTCPNSDCKFQTGIHPAAVGMIFFANNGNGSSCQDNPDITFGGLRETTISSVDSDTQIHVVGNANTTATATVCAAWGDDDTTALNTAWAAGGCTTSLYMPNGIAFISLPVFQKVAGCPSVANAGTGFQGPRVWGANVTGTYLIPRPSFNFASVSGGCGGGTAPAVCTAAVGNPNIADYENFIVWGLGERCAATLANTTLYLVGISTRAINTAGVGWCARGGGSSLIGFNINGNTDIYNYAGSNFFGSVEINISGTNVFFGNSFISGNAFSTNNTCGVTTSGSGGASLTSVSNIIGTCIAINPGGNGGPGHTFNSINTTITGNDSGGACVGLYVNATLNLLGNDVICQNPLSNQIGIIYNSTGATVKALNSQIFNNGTGFSVQGAASNSFYDVAGNTIATTGAGAWNGLGLWLGDGSITGTAQVAGNFAAGAGLSTSTFGTVSGTSRKGQVTITYAGGALATPATWTMTFPNTFIQTPVCTVTDVGGTNPFPTAIDTNNTAPTKTTLTVKMTFAAAPVAANTDVFVWECNTP